MDSMVSVAPDPTISLDALEAQTPNSEGTIPNQEPKPNEQPEQTEQQQEQKPDPIAEIRAQMERRLGEQQKAYEALRRENGQFRRQLTQTPKPQVPTALDQMDPVQRKQVEDLIQAAVEAKYADRFKQYDTVAEHLEMQREQGEFIGQIQQFTGENFKALEPVMANLLDSAGQAAQAGDENAVAFLQKVKNAPELLAFHASKIHSQSIEAKADAARNGQKANALRAANTLTSAPKAAPSASLSKDQIQSMSMADLEKLVKHEKDL